MPPLVHDMMSEQWGKQAQDSLQLLQQQRSQQQHHHQHRQNSCNNNIDLPPAPIQSTFFPGALIVGGGPSGLATAACLTDLGVPSLVLEKSSCLASLWQQKAYDRLHLHLPKQFCELPLLPFPDHLPAYPTRHQFVEYLHTYASHFKVRPLFHHQVDSATFNPTSSLWHVRVRSVISNKSELLGGEYFAVGGVQEYRVKWLVVASGENAEPVIPSFKKMQEFRGGKVFHSSQYRNGVEFVGKKVLVVGCGNSGMEIALDLANFGATPSLVVRSPTHILPREMFGRSTYEVAQKLMTKIPSWLTDTLLVSYTYFALGDTSRHGIHRPTEGPMLLKQKYGKTPILDVGTFAKIKSGHIKVMPAIECMTTTGAQFSDGQMDDFDAVILATGYRSNVPRWLKDDGKFFSTDGLPKTPFPHGWKADESLYVAGLGRKGLLGASFDAKHIAADIAASYLKEKMIVA